MLQFAESSIGDAALAALRARAEGVPPGGRRDGGAACTVVVSQASCTLASHQQQQHHGCVCLKSNVESSNAWSALNYVWQSLA